MEWLFELLAGLVIFATFWSMIPRYEWWFRVADFPRNQLIVLGFVVLIAWIGWYQPISSSEWLWVVLLIVALGFQLRMVLPYTFVWKKQVKTAVDKPDAHRVTLLVSNVLTPNPNKQALIDLVNKHQPDILLTLETDKAWEDALSVIEPDYPYNVKVPLDNLYGMHLYSKLELINPEVKYLVVDDIPSIHTQVRLKMGKVIWFYALHPMPPSPTEADKSVTRDAELLMLGRHINPHDLPVMVAGDLNDVAELYGIAGLGRLAVDQHTARVRDLVGEGAALDDTADLQVFIQTHRCFPFDTKPPRRRSAAGRSGPLLTERSPSGPCRP